jgi:hypothetical protein
LSCAQQRAGPARKRFFEERIQARRCSCLLIRSFFEAASPELGGEDAAEDGTDPVNPDLGDLAGVSSDEGGAELPGRIDGAPGEWSDGEDIEDDGETNEEAAHFGGPFIDGRSVDDEDEEESGDGFEGDALGGGDAFGERGSAAGDGAGFEDSFEDDGGDETAKALGDDVSDGVFTVDFSSGEKAERDGGIEMSAGDGSGGADHDGDGEAVSESDTDETGFGVAELGDGKNAGKTEGERTDEFTDEGFDVHFDQIG